MTSLLKKRPAISCCILTFLLSGLLLLLHMAFPAAGSYAISFPQLGPALGALVFCLLTGGPTAFTDILKHLKPQTAHLKWYAGAALLPALLVVLSALPLPLLGLPYKPWGGGAVFYFWNIFFMLLGCFGEEIGWRGFLLPTLQRRFTPFVSALIIGVIWGAWHLNFSEGILGFVLYIITITEVSIIFTWIYNKTGGSVLAMVICHFMFNLPSHLWTWERFGVKLFMVQTVLFGIACVIVLTVGRKDFFRHPAQFQNMRDENHAL